MEMDNPVSME